MRHVNFPIESIVVSTRIRKDLGDLQSLSESIKELGLLSPIVINKEGKLLAGERRLEACKLLEWKNIPAVIKKTSDAEDEVLVEISENKERKDFTREELINYAIELERIEKVKAEERKNSTQFGSTVKENFPAPEKGQTRDIVAAKLGMSGKQYEREKFIVQNKELVPPEEYTDWNNHESSTNKIYIIIKNILKPFKAKSKPKKKVVVETMEVVPEDYNELKAKVSKLEKENKELSEGNKELSSAAPTSDAEAKTIEELQTQLSYYKERSVALQNELDNEKEISSNVRQDNKHLQMSMTDTSYDIYNTSQILVSLSRVETVANEEFGKLLYSGDIDNVDEMIAAKIEKVAGNIIAMTKDLILRLHMDEVSEVPYIVY